MIRRLILAMVPLGLAAGLALSGPAAATASTRGADGPWVVSIGDSYISGEAGRWAGSSNDSYVRADALGPTAYFDNPDGTGETIERCHRSKSAAVYLGGGVSGLNLACSGAETTSYTNGSGYFKPGLDFFDDGAGHQGQASMLQDFAATHDVDLVVVSIGGNDLEFASVVEQCVTDFLTSFEWWPNFCSDDDEVESIFSEENLATVRAKIATGLRNVRDAMRTAGYTAKDWTLLIQTYPSPLPRGSGFRYGQSGWDRQFVGGCGFWNADADWTNDTALPLINQTVRGGAKQSKVKNRKILDLSHAFDGRRLCENTVGLYEEIGIADWTDPTAVDHTEWINQIRITAQDGAAATDDENPYYLQESIHPNYWAQLAIRSCVRQAYRHGDVRGGACDIAGTGLVGGEPVMKLGK